MLCTQCSLTGADEAFKKVSAAYACLSDADKRRSYDTWGTEDRSQMGGFQGFRGGGGGGDVDAEELFRAFFAQAGRPGGGAGAHFFNFGAAGAGGGRGGGHGAGEAGGLCAAGGVGEQSAADFREQSLDLVDGTSDRCFGGVLDRGCALAPVSAFGALCGAGRVQEACGDAALRAAILGRVDMIRAARRDSRCEKNTLSELVNTLSAR